ncbi:MAG: ABC transporter substrate-binding protein, partial [Egibacteraceae bacterium]
MGASESGQFPMTFKNCGRQVTIPESPERVLVIAAEAASLVWAAGAADRITTYATYGEPLGPAEDALRAVPDTLPADNLAKEAIVGQQPDVVITWGFDETTPEELAEVGIPTIIISGSCIDEGGPQSKGDFGTFEGIYTDIQLYGRLFGTEEQAARAMVELRERVATVEERNAVPEGSEAAVLQVYDEGPLTEQPGGPPVTINTWESARAHLRRAVVMVSVVALALLPGSVGTAGAASAGDEAVTLRAALGVDAEGVLDPHAYTGNLILLDMIFEPLVSYGEGGVIEPGLASSWEVSDDGLTVTFHLRDGVTFHDGTPFDAEAVRWNLDRWVGRTAFLRASQVISEVNVVDPLTIDLVLSEPYPPLLQELTVVRPVRFLSPASVGPDGGFTQALGTGPWTLESSSETGATLVRYDGYWGDQSSIERAELEVIPDSQTRLSALRAGEVDLIGGTSLAPITPVEARQLQTGDIQLLVGEPDTTVMLAFNPDGPLADPAVRVAVAQALDREALTRALFGEFGQPADTLFPPSIPYSGEPIDPSFDPNAARAALDDAGWVLDGGSRVKGGEPLELDLLAPSSPTSHGALGSTAANTAVASELEAVGIGVTINTVDEAAYFDEVNAKNWDLRLVEMLGAPYNPASNTVAYFTTGSDALWATPELDGLVNAAVLAATDAERAVAYQDVWDYLEDETAFVPLVHPSRLWAVGPAVSGFEVP